MIIPVILAGGSGSRLWPLSRHLTPKQFVNIASLDEGKTLFQSTLARLQGLPDLEPAIVICNEEHRFLAAEQLRQLSLTGQASAKATLLLEPVGCNTAPALTLAALVAQQLQAPSSADAEVPMLLVLPADHVIADTAEFLRCVAIARQQAGQGRLVTFGIEPAYAETGYGYIQAGAPLDDGSARQVSRFVEKPDLQTAEQYLASGDYLWNSGMFMMRADIWLRELASYAPPIEQACRKACDALHRDGDFVRVDAEAFSQSPSDSIDYAVMEHTRHAAVVPMAAGWSDLGAWSALWQAGQDKDTDNNMVCGDVYLDEVRDSYVHASSRLVAAIGIDNAVIVETADAVLVTNRDNTQAVKKVVQWLESHKRSEATTHTLVFRPWGSYESLATGEGFQVKRIRVRPGAALSLQMHHHRAEHWVVLSGVATVTCDERVFDLRSNESTFIPLGSRHRLQNNREEWVELIEVQTGTYLGEDDIVRFDDVYGRS
jgi:mannose-1-phosphate guanylyltransferase/mannose-6-phosphate isomerase